MFDTTDGIDLVLDSQTTVKARWPSDEEWAARAKTRKLIQRRLGRGVTENLQAEPSPADLKLFTAITANGNGNGHPVTAGEAMWLLDQMAYCTVTNVAIDGQEAVVDLTVMGGEVQHRLRLPKADQVITMRRGAYRSLELPYGHQEVRLSPEPGARLWDLCGGTATGYQVPVPGIHKDIAVRAVVEYIDRELGPRQHENF